jgi:hypothetical protein
MKTIFKVLAASILALGISAPAQALILSPSSPNPPLVDSGNQNDTNDILEYLNDNYTLGTLLYKAEVGDDDAPETVEEGPAQGSYTTVFDNEPLDPEDATITWDGPGVITDPTYLLVKDGNQVPAWYLFDISSWDGKETIYLTGFWPDEGAISHISIFGNEFDPDPDPDPDPTPDGGSVAMLLGMSLMGLAGIRRMIS